MVETNTMETMLGLEDPPLKLDLAFMYNLMQTNGELRAHIERLHDFQSDFLKSKAIEKYNEIIKYALPYFDRLDDQKYDIEYYNNDKFEVFFTGCEAHQLAMSICIKKLPEERIKAIWKNIFPNKDIVSVLEELDTNDCTLNFEHIIKGVQHDSPDEAEKLLLLSKYTYEEDDIINLLNELSLIEIAKIVPEICRVKYVSV